MVAHDVGSLIHTIEEAVLPAGSTGGNYICPYCSLRNLSEKELWYHCPAYHINAEQVLMGNCPVCRQRISEPMQVIRI